MYNDFIIDLSTASDQKIISTASNIAKFVKDNNIESTYQLKTNSKGRAETVLENGIYLVCGDEAVKNNVTYTPTPCILELPYTDLEGTLIFEADVELKYDRKEPEPEPEPEPEEPNTNPSDSGTVGQPIVQPAQSQSSTSTNQNKNVRKSRPNILPLTGDVVVIIAVLVILVILVINIIQIILSKKKKKNDE